MTLHSRIYDNLVRKKDEAYERDHDEAIAANEVLDNTLKGFVETFSGDLIKEIQAAGILIEFVPDYSPFKSKPNVMFIYDTGNIQWGEDGQKEAIVLSFGIEVGRGGNWRIHGHHRLHAMSPWQEEYLVEELQTKFRLVDDSEFKDWPQVKAEWEAITKDDYCGECETFGGCQCDYPVEIKAGETKNLPELQDRMNKFTKDITDAIPTQPDYYKPVDVKFHGVGIKERQTKAAEAFNQSLEDEAVKIMAGDIDFNTPEGEEDGFKEIDEEAREIREEKIKAFKENPDNTLGYDFAATGTNYPPGAVPLPADDEKNYTEYICPDCAQNVIRCGGYYFCTYCQKKYHEKIIEGQQNEG